MLELYSNIKKRRNELQMTMEQLAHEVGYAEKGMISRIEKGQIDLSLSKVIAIAKALKTEPGVLMGWIDPKKQANLDSIHFADKEQVLIDKYHQLGDTAAEMINTFIDTCIKAETRLYPYYRHIASAGTGFYFDDIPVDTMEAKELNGADFIIGVSGDSMEPTFSDGDDLYVHSTNHINVGDIGIFIFDGTCYVKELGEDGLVSHNPVYPMIKGSDVRCVGKVLGKVQ